LKDYAINTLDLAVAPRVGDRGVVNVDGVVLAEFPEGRANEGCAQVGDDPVWYTEAELVNFLNRSDFNTLCEFVDSY
jgi:hypothetical protein